MRTSRRFTVFYLYRIIYYTITHRKKAKMFLDKMRSAVVKTKNSGRVKPTPLPRKAEGKNKNYSAVSFLSKSIHKFELHQLVLTKSGCATEA